jgi:hypothetical protein
MALGPSNQAATPYPVVVGSWQKTVFTFTAIGSFVIVANAPPGLYRYTAVAIITTAQASQSVTVNAIVTDDQQAETIAVLSAVSTTAQGQFNGQTVLENTATANLSLSVAATATTAVGNIYVVVERIF